MAAGIQQSLIEKLRPVLPDDRMGTYLTAAGFDDDRALALYLWNAQVGEAFHTPVQAVEVSLRNRIASAFATTYGPLWWSEPEFLMSAGETCARDIDLTIKRIRQRGQVATTNQLIASLSFGFWVSLLRARFNPPVWSAQLRATFSSLPPQIGRSDLAEKAGKVLFLRNRIDHHEPIINMDLSKVYSEQMRLLAWICPIMEAWIRPNCRVPDLLRRKP